VKSTCHSTGQQLADRSQRSSNIRGGVRLAHDVLPQLIASRLVAGSHGETIGERNGFLSRATNCSNRSVWSGCDMSAGIVRHR